MDSGSIGKDKFFQRLKNRLIQKAEAVWSYWNDGIWRDTRQKWWINILKTINISVNSFTNKDLQTQACAMTYRTTLAIVPALAMLFAIGRGFGFQTVLRDELYNIFPGQKIAVEKSLTFVDSYLDQSSEGIFVGIGLLFLLWTLISLISNVETSFNRVWGVSQGRSIWRKLTDYTAMLLILPVLMVCAGGLSVFLSSTLQNAFDFSFMTPVIGCVLELASWIFTWLFFGACYKLIPNTKVKTSNALIAGVIAGSGFRILQWLFVTGQLYVTKYNAIYGSFAFLPLLLLWIQLTWVVTLTGALICYSSQNIFLYAMSSQIEKISPSYRRKVTIAIMTLITKRFVNQQPPLTSVQISAMAEIPPRLVSDVIDRLIAAGLVNRTLDNPRVEVYGYQPAISPQAITIGFVFKRLASLGESDFIPGFRKKFSAMYADIDEAEDKCAEYGDKVLLSDIEIETDNK